MERASYTKGFALEDFLNVDVRSNNAKDFQDANFNRARRWYAKSFRCVSWKSHGQEFHKAFSFLQIDCLLAPSKLIGQRVMFFRLFHHDWRRLQLLRTIRIWYLLQTELLCIRVLFHRSKFMAKSILWSGINIE